MDGRTAALLTSIENGISDGTRTTTLLQQCILLGGKSGSHQLRDWASAELNGYDGRSNEDVPHYRAVYAGIFADALVGRMSITGQTVSSLVLPKIARDAGIDENLILRQGLGELEDISSGDKSSVKFALPGSNLITRDLDADSGQPFQQTHALYWSVSTSTIRGVVEKVRTALAQFLAEIAERAPLDGSVSTKELVDKAINIVINGEQSTLNLATGSGTSTSTNQTKEIQVGDKFENISDSTIVNRSKLVNALNTLEAQGYSDSVHAMQELERLVADADEPAATECFDGLTEELNRPEPRKSVLRAMWQGIITALPYVANVAAITTGIGHLTA